MPKGLILSGLLLVIPAFSASARAEPFVIASVLIDLETGSDATGGTGFFVFAMSPTVTNRLFENYPLTAASSGTTLVANADNDRHFAEIARQMTNGVPNWTEYILGAVPGAGGGGVGSSGEAAIFGLAPGMVDFRGFTLSSLTLAIEAFSTRRDPVFPHIEQRHLRARLSVLGEGQANPAPVPEPATVTLLVGGIAAVAAARRRAKRRANKA